MIQFVQTLRAIGLNMTATSNLRYLNPTTWVSQGTILAKGQRNYFAKNRKKSLTFSVVWVHNITKGDYTLKQDDLQIVHAIRGGDSTAFTALVEKYKKAVYGVILPKVRDFHQAQDLTSETFVTAYLSIESLDTPEKVGIWLCGIARNLTNKWLYREKRDDLSVEGLLENTSESAHKAQLLQVSAAEKTPDETAEHAELRQLLWRCLISLPDISSEVLILSYIREMKSVCDCKVSGDFTDSGYHAIVGRTQTIEAGDDSYGRKHD